MKNRHIIRVVVDETNNTEIAGMTNVAQSEMDVIKILQELKSADVLTLFDKCSKTVNRFNLTKLLIRLTNKKIISKKYHFYITDGIKHFSVIYKINDNIEISS